LGSESADDAQPNPLSPLTSLFFVPFHAYCFAFLIRFVLLPVMRELLLVFVIAAVGGVAAGFLAMLFAGQFIGYRPVIEIPGERSWRASR
jgi:hypothetical protein